MSHNPVRADDLLKKDPFGRIEQCNDEDGAVVNVVFTFSIPVSLKKKPKKIKKLKKRKKKE